MDVVIDKVEEFIEKKELKKKELVSITLKLTIKSEKDKVLAAGVDVDGLEMIEATRIALKKGENVFEFDPIKIFREFNSSGVVEPRKYKFTIAFVFGGDKSIVYDHIATF